MTKRKMPTNDLELEIECLRQALEPFSKERLSSEVIATSALYVSPAEKLRRQAAAIEERDNNIRRARRLLEGWSDD